MRAFSFLRLAAPTFFAALLGACGGGGSATSPAATSPTATGSDPQTAEVTGVFSGFSGDLSFVLSDPGAGVGAGADGQGGIGIGSNVGIMRGADVTVVRLTDGKVLGTAKTDSNGYVTARPGKSYAGGLAVEMRGNASATHYNIASDSLEPLGPNDFLRAVVSSIPGNIGVDFASNAIAAVQLASVIPLAGGSAFAADRAALKETTLYTRPLADLSFSDDSISDKSMGDSWGLHRNNIDRPLSGLAGLHAIALSTTDRANLGLGLFQIDGADDVFRVTSPRMLTGLLSGVTYSMQNRETRGGLFGGDSGFAHDHARLFAKSGGVRYPQGGSIKLKTAFGNPKHQWLTTHLVYKRAGAEMPPAPLRLFTAVVGDRVFLLEHRSDGLVVGRELNGATGAIGGPIDIANCTTVFPFIGRSFGCVSSVLPQTNGDSGIHIYGTLDNGNGGLMTVVGDSPLGPVYAVNFAPGRGAGGRSPHAAPWFFQLVGNTFVTGFPARDGDSTPNFYLWGQADAWARPFGLGAPTGPANAVPFTSDVIAGITLRQPVLGFASDGDQVLAMGGDRRLVSSKSGLIPLSARSGKSAVFGPVDIVFDPASDPGKVVYDRGDGSILVTSDSRFNQACGLQIPPGAIGLLKSGDELADADTRVARARFGSPFWEGGRLISVVARYKTDGIVESSIAAFDPSAASSAGCLSEAHSTTAALGAVQGFPQIAGSGSAYEYTFKDVDDSLRTEYSVISSFLPLGF